MENLLPNPFKLSVPLISQVCALHVITDREILPTAALECLQCLTSYNTISASN